MDELDDLEPITPEGDEEGDEWIPNPDWIYLTSVGIDIGSSTSHLMFSRLVLRRKGVQLSSRFVVVRREVLYRSPILVTPYRDADTIDTDVLSDFIIDSYRQAGLEPGQVDTGAVICTGEAVRKKNAEAISRMLSARAGRFVCVTAGPNLEGVLAAHGSGSVARSRDDSPVLNVDLGGGTCKVSLAREGEVVATGAINVGARLVAWDDEGRLTRIERAGARVAESVGVPLSLAETLSTVQRRNLAAKLADLLMEFIQGEDLSPLARELLVTEPLSDRESPVAVLLSGGVGEYVYERERSDYGDLGPMLGDAVRERLRQAHLPVELSNEQIRATVIGASQYTIQVSSSTVFLSREGILPLRDVQVVAPRLGTNGHYEEEEVSMAVRHALDRFDLDGTDRLVGLSLRGRVEPSYPALRNVAGGIVAAMQQREGKAPWILVFDTDIGGLVGALLKNEFGVQPDIVAVDEIEVGDFDFIDIGQPVSDSQALPVVVKSLVFG